MARIEAYSRTALNDDITMRTEVNGEYTTLFVDNGFYTLMDGRKIKVGDSHFNLRVKVHTEVQADNSIKYTVSEPVWSDFQYNAVGNYDTPFTLHIWSIDNSGGLTKVWDISFGARNSFTRTVAQGHTFFKEGVIAPNGDLNAQIGFELLRYYNDGKVLDDDIYGGIKIVNDLPPSVRPKAVYDCGSKTFKTTNRDNGTIRIYNCVSGNFDKEVRTINQGKAPVNMGAGVFSCGTDEYKNQHQVGER